jgi:protein-S-isoprenylcysteine O-methyltransferase Ste14
MEIPTYLKSPDPSSLLALLILVATYITTICITPPNPAPSPSPSSEPTDRIIWVTTPLFLSTHRLLVLFLGLPHAILILTYSWGTGKPQSSTTICPNAHQLSPSLFTFSTYTLTLLLLILTFGPLRLLCYYALGPNFTFQLAPPGKLTTTGLYAYMQHPSYKFQIIVLMAYTFLTLRRDGAMGCWLPEWVVKSEEIGIGMKAAVGVGLVGGLWGLGVRVRDEERMLRARFGKEWEVWHAGTKRFVPGVF